jgi:tripartite-type tricarboxylate transporter receptor subunit TctC
MSPFARCEPVPNLEADLWDGVVAPANTPKEIIAEIASWFISLSSKSCFRSRRAARISALSFANDMTNTAASFARS